MDPGLKLLAVLLVFGLVLSLVMEEYGVGWMFAVTSIAGSFVISAAVARVNDEIEAHREEKRLASKKPGRRSLDSGDP